MLAQKLYTRPIRTIYQCSLLGDERCQTGVGDEGLMIDYDDSKLTVASDTEEHHRSQVAPSGVTVMSSWELICAYQVAGVNP